MNKGLGILSILKHISESEGLEPVNLLVGWHLPISRRYERKNTGEELLF